MPRLIEQPALSLNSSDSPRRLPCNSHDAAKCSPLSSYIVGNIDVEQATVRVIHAGVIQPCDVAVSVALQLGLGTSSLGWIGDKCGVPVSIIASPIKKDVGADLSLALGALFLQAGHRGRALLRLRSG